MKFTVAPTAARLLASTPLIVALLVLASRPGAAEEAEGPTPVAPNSQAEAYSVLPGAESTRRDTAGDAVDDRIREVEAKEGGRIQPFRGTRDAVRSWRLGVERRYGLSFGIDYTVLYQRASEGRGPRDAAGGDLDLFARWRAFGKDDFNAGTLYAYTEWRHRLGTEIAPFNLSKSMGTLHETTTGFTEQPFAVTQLYWEQDWGRGRWTGRLGKLDPAILYFGNRINNVNTYFVGYPFSDNPAVFFPGAALGASLRYRIDDAWSLTLGVQDANGERLGDAFETIQDGELWWAGQLQHSRCVRGLGVGNYRVGMWYSEPRTKAERPDGGGFVLSLDQELGRPGAVGFLRYEYQTDPLESARQGTGATRQGLVPSRQALRVGAALESVVRHRAWMQDVLGAGFSWSEPYNDELRDEFLFETFWRFQISPDVQLTPSYQLFIDPANNRSASTISVFSIRFRLLL